MSKKLVHISSIDAFMEETILIDRDDDIVAEEDALRGEGEAIRNRIYGIEHDMMQVSTKDVEDESDAYPTWEVIGIFADTDNLQPFTHETKAETPRMALLKTLAWRDGPTTVSVLKSDLEGDANLKDLCQAYAIRPVSIRKKSVVTDQKEYLHEIDDFSSVDS